MSHRFSVVIPVKNGARYLNEIIQAVQAEPEPVEFLIIDSGSTDGSQAIARSAGVRLVDILPEEFGHGHTRNLAAELTSGEFICFLTQDATPKKGWLAAFAAAFALDDKVGVAYGPHLPRADTPPMIARELTEFFTSFSADGEPVVQSDGAGSEFLSNVNACYRRSCLEEVRFRDLPYSEDQQFARDMAERSWLKVYNPQAAVFHAHDYSAIDFMRRYFDEYRGLRAAVGHVERIGIRSTVRDTFNLTRADYRWMVEHQFPSGSKVRWTLRSILHHTSRKVFSALGSHADRLPQWLQKLLSLEKRSTLPAAPFTEAVPAGDKNAN